MSSRYFKIYMTTISEVTSGIPLLPQNDGDIIRWFEQSMSLRHRLMWLHRPLELKPKRNIYTIGYMVFV